VVSLRSSETPLVITVCYVLAWFSLYLLRQGAVNRPCPIGNEEQNDEIAE